MSNLNPETLSTDDVRRLLEERDELEAEVARLSASIKLSSMSLDLLKEAACRALEYLIAPNPFAEPVSQRKRAIARLEDALSVNGLVLTRFDVRSDAN